MSNRANGHRGTILALAGLLAVGAFLLPLASASPIGAISAPNPNAPPQQWAYGGSYGATSTGSASGWGTTGNWSYTTSVHGFLGWNVVFTQTNTSSTTFTLQEQRTVLAEVYVQACSPTCTNPTASANLTSVAWEVDNAFANFTTQGTVYVNGTGMTLGTPTPALAIVNAQGDVRGNATSTASWTTATNSGSAYLSAAAEAQASVVFSPSLGLVPMNPSPGMWWNSSSAYTSSGSYNVACHYDYQGPIVKTAGTCGSSGSLTGSGTVALSGADLGRTTVGGYLADRLSLALAGAHFRFVDGAILVPASADLMAGAGTTASAGPAGTGVGALGTTEVDFSAGGSHLGLVAAKAQLTSSAASTVPVGDTTSSGSSPVAYSAQAQPESVSQAQASNACLMGSCAASSSGAKLPFGLSAVVLVAGVAVIALVGALIYVHRRPKAPTSVQPYSAAPAPTPQHRA